MTIPDASMRKHRKQAEIRRSRPGRLGFVALNVMMVGTAYGLFLLRIALGLIGTGLFVNLEIVQVGLVFLAAAIVCPVVSVIAIYNVMLARRWALVIAFLMSLVTPALELRAMVISGRSAWPFDSLTGSALVFHLIAGTSLVSLLVLLSPATLRWVANARNVEPSLSLGYRSPGTPSERDPGRPS